MSTPTFFRSDSTGHAGSQESPPGTKERHLSSTEQSLLLAVVYADVFDFPLTRRELYRRAIRERSDRSTFEEALISLSDDYLSSDGEYVFLRGREELVDLRLEREARAAELWPHAARFAEWFRYIPFIRAVAVSGSLAVGNVNRTSDIDFFCITEARRLWVARLFIVPLSKLTRHLRRIFPLYLCPNYLVATNALDITENNLFTAHEITQAVPMWGADVHRAFLDANRWTDDLLPRAARVPAPAEDEAARPLTTRLLERTVGGRIGDWLNEAAHRAFVSFYRRRAERNGWPWAHLAPAYQIDRYTVPEGGYSHVIADLFRRRVKETAARAIPESQLDVLFEPRKADDFVHNWTALFQSEYGAEA